MSNKTKNTKLAKAKSAKNDEFYTQYSDIEKEMNAYLEYNPDIFRGKTIFLPCDDPEWSNFTLYFAQNFSRFGIKKLISTSYARANKNLTTNKKKSNTRGKFFELEHNIANNGVIDIKDVKWVYLKGDGDFRSAEVKAIRDMADIIITNPPFSLFREFFAWIMEDNKKFAIICNKNCVTYKEVFPLIKENKIWSGQRKWAGGMWFETKYGVTDKVIDKTDTKNIPSIWITNIEHRRRHKPLQLMTMVDNKRFNRKIQDKNTYKRYDNYCAIEVPMVQAIPSDYRGVMGVPISFLDKYSPEQFKIIGATESEGRGFSGELWDFSSKIAQPMINGNKVYKRIFIKNVSPGDK